MTEDGGRSWRFSHGRLARGDNSNVLAVTKRGVLWRLDDDGRVLLSLEGEDARHEAEGQPPS